jgi:hypothetical protein
MMRRAMILTFRLQRFEILAAAGVIALIAAAAVFVPGRLTALGVPAECFAHEGLPGCRDLLDVFYSIRANEASWMLGVGAGLFPVAIGLLLGTPIVAREVELGTTSLAWSLTGDRSRWLIQRLVPGLAVLVLGLSLLGILGSAVLHATEPAGVDPRLDQLGSQGPSFVARGVMALGLALLVGSLLGRTLSGFVVSGLLCLALVIVGAPALYTLLASEWAVWRDAPSDGRTPMIIEFGERYREPSGRVLSWDEFDAIYASQPNPEPWIEDHLIRSVYGLPVDGFGDLERAETALALGIGAVSIALAFPVVAHRRPR